MSQRIGIRSAREALALSAVVALLVTGAAAYTAYASQTSLAVNQGGTSGGSSVAAPPANAVTGSASGLMTMTAVAAALVAVAALVFVEQRGRLAPKGAMSPES